MARTIEPSCRQCRREGCKLFLKGERCTSKKCAMERRPVKPGQHGNTRKVTFTEYGTQLREKQKIKRTYGILERQMRGYYDEASRLKGKTGETMLILIERRLDNVVYRMGIASSRAQARQIVNHGLVCVNGKRVDIPSYEVKKGDEISIKENKTEKTPIKALKGIKIVMPKWVEFNTETLKGTIVALPTREDIDAEFNEQLVVELYSR